MNIAVIAVSGRSGKVFTEYALAKGHTVRAGVRRSHNLTAHPRLTVVTCNATNEQDLAHLIHGQDAVVSFIGHVKGSPKNVQTEAMQAIHSAMLTEKNHTINKSDRYRCAISWRRSYSHRQATQHGDCRH